MPISIYNKSFKCLSFIIFEIKFVTITVFVNVGEFSSIFLYSIFFQINVILRNLKSDLNKVSTIIRVYTYKYNSLTETYPIHGNMTIIFLVKEISSDIKKKNLHHKTNTYFKTNPQFVQNLKENQFNIFKI